MDPIPANTLQYKTILFPVNPSDINQIQGTYPSAPPLHPTLNAFIPGNEGLLQITHLPSSSSPNTAHQFSLGDHCIPIIPCFGTWRQQGQTDINTVMKVSKDPLFTVGLSVNTSTAYRLLMDNPSTHVIQNGASSQVAIRVIELAKHLGRKTINIIRNTTGSVEEKKRLLEERGGDWVFTEEQLKEPKIKSFIRGLNIEVGLNCVGGKGVGGMCGLMGDRSTLITYGGMSGLPLFIGTSALIFKDMTMKGYWMTRWYKEHTLEERKEMIDTLCTLRRNGVFKDINSDVLQWKINASDEENDFVLKRVLERCEGKNTTRLLISVVE